MADVSNLSSGAGGNNMSATGLQTLVDEENFEELQYQLYIREIQRLNPSLREGCMFVDGLYELVCSRLPVQIDRGDANLKNSARDFLTLHTTDMLLLQKYWHKPQEQDEYTAYLTVATSFVHYLFTKFGPQGVSEFLQQLDYTVDDPLAEKFRFKGQDILKLEFKWKKFVEAEVNANFRLSVAGMLHMLFTRYLIHYWLRLIIVLVLILADVGLEFLYSLAFAELIALGFSRGPMDHRALFQWVGVLIVTLLVRFAVLLISAGILVTMAVSVSNRIRAALSDRFRGVTPLYLADHTSSSLLTTFSQDVNIVEKVISTAVRAIAVAMVLVITCFLYSAVIVWPLSIYLASLFLLSQLLNHFVGIKLSIYLFAKGQANGKLCDILKEQIDGFLVSRIYRLGDLWKGQIHDTIRQYYTSQARKALYFTNFCWFFQQMVPNVSIATMLFGIIILSREGYTDFTAGVSVFLFYIRVSVGLTAAASMFPELQAASTAMGRINALLNNKAHNLNTTTDESGSDGSSSQGGSIESGFEEQSPDSTVPALPIDFRGVCFSYNMSAAHWNLYNVSLEIKAGERVVIVGTTGSGKSTLLMLAMQLYKPNVGEVILGGGKSPFYHGVPKISTTFQSNHMFSMSLRENIRLGNLAASNEEVEQAARKADIHDWIMTLARGYDTPVKSGGSSLSGGQRQRIAIARMLVAKSPICLLDEVTSALDPVTETRVFSKLMEVTKGRTVIAITHKLDQARHFDRIVVMSHGKVKEVGSHSGLMAHKGVYWRMCNNDMSVTPGRPVPIPRRRSSSALQIGNTPHQPPELSIVPLSTPRDVAGTKNPTPAPVFEPLQPLVETGEGRLSHALSHTTQEAPGSPSHTHSPTPTSAPAINAPMTSENDITPPRDDIMIQNMEERSYAPRRSSTPLLHTASQMRSGASTGSMEDTATQSLHPLQPGDEASGVSQSVKTALQGAMAASSEQNRAIEEEGSADPLQIPGVSKSMETGLQVVDAGTKVQKFDANQTLPPRLIESQTGTGLRRHQALKFHSSTTPQHEEPLRSQLEKVLSCENSLVSLASFFELDLRELAAMEERGRGLGEEGGEGRGEEGKMSTDIDMCPQVDERC